MPDARPVEEVIESIARRAWRLFKADSALYVMATVIVCVPALVSFGGLYASLDLGPTAVALCALGVLTIGGFFGPLVVGLIRVVRHRLRAEPALLGDVFAAMSTFVPALLVFDILVACLAVGWVLFVVPGLLALIVLGFAFHEIAYKDAGIVAALTGSYRVLAKNAVLVILMILLVAVLNTLAAVTLIGVLLTLPYSLIALTVCYEEITGLT